MDKQGYILLVEDEPDVQNLVRLHLERAGYRVSSFDNAEEAYGALLSLRPDLAIIDWMLPGASGLHLCRKIEAAFPIVMLTARADPRDIVTGLNAGADDYITKPFAIPVLLARVAAVLRRHGRLNASPSSQFSIGSTIVDPLLRTCLSNGESIVLTPMEFRLFVALAEAAGKVLTREKLMDLVHGMSVSVTERTVDQHVFTLRKKLGVDGALIETVRGVGYRVGAMPGDLCDK